MREPLQGGEHSASYSDSPVLRSRARAQEMYSRIAPWYDWLEGWWERKARAIGLDALAPAQNARVLEIGPGPGHNMVALAQRVGQGGSVVGVDLACGMLRVARRRLTKLGLTDRAHLVQGDGAVLPLQSNTFDAAFMSFTLELFDTPEIAEVLSECRRVLRPNGALAVVSLFRAARPTVLDRLYRKGHQRLPSLLDCRPISLDLALLDAGFLNVTGRARLFWGLTVAVAVGDAP